MNCNECLELVDALIDNELSPEETGLMAEHLTSCAECARATSEQRALSTRIRKLKPFAPEPELRENITAALDEMDGTDIGNQALSQTARFPFIPQTVLRGLLGGALGAAIGAALMMLVFNVWIIPALNRSHETRELVSAHIRSLMGNEIVELASTDRHILKPWFGGKLNFAPAITSLTKSGYPLKGARIDYLFENRVAVVVYTRRAHKINLFIAPLNQGTARSARIYQANGYNFEEFTSGQYRYIAISDLNARELGEFSDLIKNSQ